MKQKSTFKKLLGSREFLLFVIVVAMFLVVSAINPAFFSFKAIQDMMKNNVVENYGEWNFEGMDMYAKSGTAETGSWTPDAWFVGFTDDEDAPYAFVVWVKEGGFGAEAAAPIAARVIRALGSSGE